MAKKPNCSTCQDKTKARIDRIVEALRTSLYKHVEGKDEVWTSMPNLLHEAKNTTARATFRFDLEYRDKSGR